MTFLPDATYIYLILSLLSPIYLFLEEQAVCSATRVRQIGVVQSRLVEPEIESNSGEEDSFVRQPFSAEHLALRGEKKEEKLSESLRRK